MQQLGRFSLAQMSNIHGSTVRWHNCGLRSTDMHRLLFGQHRVGQSINVPIGDLSCLQLQGILSRLVGCFVYHRDPDQIEHTMKSLIKQRVMGLALGYEDLNDHDALRADPLLGLLSDVADPMGVPANLLTGSTSFIRAWRKHCTTRVRWKHNAVERG